MVPNELQTLHSLRRRGQCPSMTVFVTDVWKWQQAMSKIGALCIRVSSLADHLQDWRAIRGLECMLLQKSYGDYAPLAQSLLSVGPSYFETFHLNQKQHDRRGWLLSRLVVGEPRDYEKTLRRDFLLNCFLNHA